MSNVDSPHRPIGFGYCAIAMRQRVLQHNPPESGQVRRNGRRLLRAQHGLFCRTGCLSKETSICIVDDTGRIVCEAKVASEPDALLAVLKSGVYRFKRIRLEAGPLSQWLYSAFAEAHLPVICVETRHMRAV